MLETFAWHHVAFLVLAAGLDVVSNVFLKYSNGFRNRLMGGLSVLSIMVAFIALSQALRGFELSVAYALWGAFGLGATVIAGCVLFGDRITPRGYAGFAVLLVGVGMLKFA